MTHMKGMSYKKFMVMMLTSFLIMYIVMFLNMDKLGHYHTSEQIIQSQEKEIAEMEAMLNRLEK